MAEGIIKNTDVINPRLASDMDAEIYGPNGIHYNRYDANTAHTPYSEGLIGAAGGFCITLKSGSYGSQIVYPDGSTIIYSREFYPSGSALAAGSWKTLIPT